MSCRSQATANPNAWKAKDAAVYLVIALTLKGGTSKLGATQTNSLVNLGDFFTSHVLPELGIDANMMRRLACTRSSSKAVPLLTSSFALPPLGVGGR